MKKLITIVLILLVSIPLFGQTKYDSPRSAAMDTLVACTTTRVVRDIYLNPANDASAYPESYGVLDLQIVADMWSSVETTDTLTVEAYGIKRVRHSKTQGWATDGLTTYAVDSTRIGTIPVTTTATLNHYALDLLFTTLYQYDGFRIVLKSNGAEATRTDSVKTWTQIRSYVPSTEMLK